jgi:hypothetical protein
MSVQPVTSPVNLTLVERHCALRHMRNVKADLQTAIQHLQEQQRMGHNGHRNSAMVVLDGELHIVEEVCKKLWESVAGPPISSGAVPP